MSGRTRAGFFKVIRFDRTLRGSEQALRYAPFRSEDVKGREPNIFDDRTNSADVQAFARSLDDRVSRHHSAAKAYHTVFSLKRPDFERAGMDDWREVVREVMQGHELETGRRLHWIAVNHDNLERPHCHVIIKATYTAQDGRERKLYLNRREVERIKEITERSLQARGLEPAKEQQLQQERQQLPGIKAARSILHYLQQQIQKAHHDEVRQADSDRRRLERGPGPLSGMEVGF